MFHNHKLEPFNWNPDALSSSEVHYDNMRFAFQVNILPIIKAGTGIPERIQIKNTITGNIKHFDRIPNASTIVGNLVHAPNGGMRTAFYRATIDDIAYVCIVSYTISA